MVVIEGKQFIYIDVDDTLVFWNNDRSWDKNNKEAISFKDPYVERLDENTPFTYIYLKPNYEVINKLKVYKKEGKTIVVWSAGGWKWAKEVVNTLELQDYVDVVLSKPSVYIDDCFANEFMGQHILITPWKVNNE